MTVHPQPHPAQTQSGANGANNRGGPQPPNSAEGAATDALSVQARVLSVKLDPPDEQWKRLRELAWQAMQYKNNFIRARWAEAIGLRMNPEAGDKADITKYVRKHHKGELSGCAYSAAEREVQQVWTRDAKKILAGAPIAQWRQNDALSVRGHKLRDESGVRIVEMDNRLFADLLVQNKDCEGGCWIRVRVAKGTERDYQAPILSDMAAGRIPILKGTVVFVPAKGRTYLRLCWKREYALPPMGARVATMGWVEKRAKRFLLRTETSTVDYTQRLHVLRERKLDWDDIRRRVHAQLGRRKGSARAKRKCHALNDLQAWERGYLHEWSRHMVDWCTTQGVGRIVIADLAGGDWPAHMLEELVRYKAHDAGMTVDKEVCLEDASTERAAKRVVERERRKAKKKGNAVRELLTQIGDI